MIWKGCEFEIGHPSTANRFVFLPHWLLLRHLLWVDESDTDGEAHSHPLELQ
jgi:hypothetical protein